MRRRISTTDRSNDNTIVDLTGIGTGSSSSNSVHSNDGSSYSPYLCKFCDVALIRKMDDPGDSKRYICPRCANIQDPLKVDEFNKIKHAERGQTIRSSSSAGGGGNEEGRPWTEMFNSNTSTADDKGSLKGTQLSRALQKTDIINYNVNEPEPNEEANLRGQGYRILKTETTYPESGRKVVKTFD